jgi:hypothetical protein
MAAIGSSFAAETSDNSVGGGARMRRCEAEIIQAWTPMSGNERKTENVVRDAFRKLGYYDETTDIRVEEQKSNIESVKKLLRAASKSCQGGKGSPEFIVSSPGNPDFLLIVECKGSAKDHASDDADNLWTGAVAQPADEEYSKRCQRFGVDGVLHYARYLSKEFNVLAVAVSGETKAGAKTSIYLHTKGDPTPNLLKNKDGKAVNSLIPWTDFIEHATFDPTVQRMRFDELMAFARLARTHAWSRQTNRKRKAAAG